MKSSLTWRLGRALTGVSGGTETAELLDVISGLLSEHLCNCGVVHPYSANHPADHQRWCRFRAALEEHSEEV